MERETLYQRPRSRHLLCRVCAFVISRCELLDACPVSHVDEAVVVNHYTAHKFACPKTTAEVELSCGTAPLPPLRLIAALTDPASIRRYLQGVSPDRATTE